MAQGNHTQPNQSTISIGMLPISPIGPLWVAVSERGLVAVDWQMSRDDFTRTLQSRYPHHLVYDDLRTFEPLNQLSEYLDGRLKQFDLPLDFAALTPFQQRALALTCDIPYGETSTYRQLACLLGNPRAARAVGRAEATNPIPLVIPCHRVLGTDGALHGYGGPGGIQLKAWLLELERLNK